MTLDRLVKVPKFIQFKGYKTDYFKDPNKNSIATNDNKSPIFVNKFANSPQLKIRLLVEKKYMQIFLAYKDNILNPTANINSLSVISLYITENQQNN